MHRPARAVHQPARRKAGHRDPAEDDKIVQALKAAALFRALCAGQHGRGADEAEVPSEAQQDQRQKEILQLEPRHGDGSGCGKDRQAQGYDPLTSKARDQVAGEERRRIHRQHMRRDDIGRMAFVKAAADNRQG